MSHQPASFKHWLSNYHSSVAYQIECVESELPDCFVNRCHNATAKLKARSVIMVDVEKKEVSVTGNAVVLWYVASFMKTLDGNEGYKATEVNRIRPHFSDEQLATMPSY